MLMLRVENQSKALVIREFAVMRDGEMMIKVMDSEGITHWEDAKGLEVISI